MSYELVQLVEAEKKAAELFNEIEIRGLIRPGRTEKEINKSIYDLAFEMFKIKKYWHKRIVDLDQMLFTLMTESKKLNS